jgi:hypothetical protein
VSPIKGESRKKTPPPARKASFLLGSNLRTRIGDRAHDCMPFLPRDGTDGNKETTKRRNREVGKDIWSALDIGQNPNFSSPDCEL